MRRRLKTWEIRCDHCAEAVTVTSFSEPPSPKGWGAREQHNCGSTGYTKTLELCGRCLRRFDRNEKKWG